MTSTLVRDADPAIASQLSVILIGPHEGRRGALRENLSGTGANIAREFAEYPSIDTLSSVALDCDVVIVDLDSDRERALYLVENICARCASVALMVYSSKPDAELVVHCMRAGAREFLAEPVLPGVLGDALSRAAARRHETRRRKKVAGKMFVFIGAKGGCGVTTLASSFAIALNKESGAGAVLVDLDLPLGDAALSLGITNRFSILDALRNESRLDSDFVASLLVKHGSGISVLGAPDEYSAFQSTIEGKAKLLRILREDFPYVVVDAGFNLGNIHEPLFELAETIYLVAQVSVAELRNSRRLISHFAKAEGKGKLEVILNRFDSRNVEIDDERIASALTQPPRWKIPNDYVTTRRAQNTGIPVAMEDSSISRALFEMARAACGRCNMPIKKKRFGLFG